MARGRGAQLVLEDQGGVQGVEPALQQGGVEGGVQGGGGVAGQDTQSLRDVRAEHVHE